MAGKSKIPMVFKILTLFAALPTFVECQITSVISPKVACVGDDVDIDWVYGDASNFLSITWTYINTQTSAQTVIMQQNAGGSATVTGTYNVVHKTNGGIKLTGVTLANSGSYKISVTYLSGNSPDDNTVTVTVNDCSTSTPPTNCTCECKCKCKRIVIPSIVFGGLGAVSLTVVIGGTVTEHFGRTTALVVDSIGIVCDALSLVLGIVVQIIDCCKASDCCEDSDCCKDGCESRNWIENAGAAFIAIGALVGIAGGVIFYLIWSNRMGPGNNAYKAKEAKDPGENHGMTGTSM